MCSPLKRGKVWKVAALILAAVAMGVPRTASADQCIPDDLIVDGSINCGFDSVCNRNFGFDTLVLSENNLRIFFEDTSSTASFPTNDWRILINDTTNGGSSFFAVEDSTAGNRPFTVRAGAGSNALFVDNGGEVGLGTAVPVVNLHIVDGNTPTVRLDQNGSQGFTPQVWDLAGNEANFFIRDVTNGSKLPFRITPNTPTSTIRMFTDKIAINDGGLDYDTKIRGDNVENLFYVDAGTDRIGVGTDTPADDFHIHNDVSPAFHLTNSTTGQTSGDGFTVQAQGNNALIQLREAGIMQFFTNNAERIRIGSGGNVGIGTISVAQPLTVVNAQCDGNNWNNTSSRALKQGIRDLDLEEAKAAFKLLHPVKFAYKSRPDEECVGFIAEDVPDLVAIGERKSLNSMDLVGVLTKVVQDQQKTIDELADKVSQLEKGQNAN